MSEHRAEEGTYEAKLTQNLGGDKREEKVWASINNFQWKFLRYPKVTNKSFKKKLTKTGQYP